MLPLHYGAIIFLVDPVGDDPISVSLQGRLASRVHASPFNLFVPPLRIGLSYSGLQPGPITRFGLKGIF